MPIIRITKEQIEKAAKARKIALKKDPDLRELAEQHERMKNEAVKAIKKDRQS